MSKDKIIPATPSDQPSTLPPNPVPPIPAATNPAAANPVPPSTRIGGQLKKEKFGYSLPVDAPLFPEFPYQYKNCTIVTFEYVTDPAAAALFLPTQLTLDPKPRVKMLFATYPWSSIGFYNEVAQSLICQYVDEKGQPYKAEDGTVVEFNYPLRMHVTSDTAMAAGREIAGIPKKMGAIQFSLGSEYFGHLDSRNGSPVCSFSMTPKKLLLAQIQEFPLNYLSLRLMPGVPGVTDKPKPKVCELLASTWMLGPGQMWSGTGNLILHKSKLDPYDRLPIVEPPECRVFCGDMEARSLKLLLDF